jgi:hypothetical protein
MGNRALLGIAAAALTVIVGLGAWAIGSSGSGEGEAPGGTGQTGTSKPAQPQAGKLAVQDVSAAEDSPQGRHDTTIGKRLGVIADGRTGEAWETQTYADVNFGRYARALGVVLDMGRTVEVSSVKIAAPEGGGTIQVKAGDQREPGAMTGLGSQRANAGETTVKPASRARARYILVWFTELPPSRKGKISEVTVYGVAR